MGSQNSLYFPRNLKLIRRIIKSLLQGISLEQFWTWMLMPGVLWACYEAMVSGSLSNRVCGWVHCRIQSVIRFCFESHLSLCFHWLWGGQLVIRLMRVFLELGICINWLFVFYEWYNWDEIKIYELITYRILSWTLELSSHFVLLRYRTLPSTGDCELLIYFWLQNPAWWWTGNFCCRVSSA